jgi:hypothetical protein
LIAVDLDARVLRMRLPAGLTQLSVPLTGEERAAQQAGEDEGDRNAL